MRPVSLLPKTPKGRLSFVRDLLQAQVVSARPASSRSFPQLRDIDLLDLQEDDYCIHISPPPRPLPDTIFLTRDERRTLLEKITMKERDEKRMKNWVFG